MRLTTGAMPGTRSVAAMADDTTTDQQDQRDADQQDASTEPLGDAGKAALDRERADRKAAEKRARDAEQKLADIEAARAKAEEAEKVEQGKWEELAGKREAALQETTTERDSLKATNEALTQYFDTQYTAALTDLPDVIKAFAPADDAPFAAKAEWLVKAQEQAAKVDTTGTPGNRPNPPPSTGHRDLEAAKAQARRKYSI